MKRLGPSVSGEYYDAGSRRPGNENLRDHRKSSAEEERLTREKVISYLAGKPPADEKALAIEGLRYLRNVRELEPMIKDERHI
jgi:hypothetical protein